MLSFQSILLFFIAIFTTIVNVENAADLNNLNKRVSQKHELSNDSFTPATKGSLEKGINNFIIPEREVKIFSEGSEFTLKLLNDSISTKINHGSEDSAHARVPPAAEKIADSKNVSGEKVASEMSAESKEPKSDIRNITPSSTLINSATVDNNSKVTKPQESISVLPEKSVSGINVESVDPKTVQGNTTTKSITINSPIVSAPNNSNTKTPEISKSNSTVEVNTTTTKKPVPKKPLITIGSEGLPDAGVAVTPEEVLPSPSTTSDGLVHTNPQYYQSSVNQLKGQPGYIIPIVITLFALPLLVLIGYQAVRRGKEAWRNRHYRRMDFLIDDELKFK